MDAVRNHLLVLSASLLVIGGTARADNAGEADREQWRSGG